MLHSLFLQVCQEQRLFVLKPTSTDEESDSRSQSTSIRLLDSDKSFTQDLRFPPDTHPRQEDVWIAAVPVDLLTAQPLQLLTVRLQQESPPLPPAPRWDDF